MSMRLSALRAGRLLPLGRFVVLISVRSWVDPRAIVRLKRLGQLKDPMNSSEIELAAFRREAHKSLVRPILEYGAACWDPYRECDISALDRVQNKAAKFVQCTGGSVWESLVQRRMTARLYAFYKAHNAERAWKYIGNSLQAPHYLSRVIAGK
jgi:hypothetical protein